MAAMNTESIYMVVTIGVLIIVALLVYLTNRREKRKRLSPLAGLAFAFVLAGILFGQDKLIGYSLMGVGVVLAVVDIFKKSGSS